MEPQSTNAVLPTLESNIDQLLQELHHLATRVKLPDQHQQHNDLQNGQGQFLIARGRS